MSVLDRAYELDSPAVISDEVGGETLAINLNSGAYFVIPPTALTVWAAVSGGVLPRQLLHGEDDPRAEGLEAYVRQLADAGLLRLREAEPAPSPVIAPWSVEDLGLTEHTEMADLLGLDPIHDVDVAVGWPAARPAGQ